MEKVTVFEGVMRTPEGLKIIGNAVPLSDADSKKLPHGVVLVLIKSKNGRILLQKRSRFSKYHPLQFTLGASGRIRNDETVEQAASREAFEETGVELRNVKLITAEPLKTHPDAAHIHYFAVEASCNGKLSLSEREVHAEGTRFYTVSEVKKLLKTPKLFTPPVYSFLTKHLSK